MTSETGATTLGTDPVAPRCPLRGGAGSRGGVRLPMWCVGADVVVSVADVVVSVADVVVSVADVVVGCRCGGRCRCGVSVAGCGGVGCRCGGVGCRCGGVGCRCGGRRLPMWWCRLPSGGAGSRCGAPVPAAGAPVPAAGGRQALSVSSAFPRRWKARPSQACASLLSVPYSASAFWRWWNVAGRNRWCRHRRSQRNRWNRDRQRRPRPRHHPSAGPLRARKHLQRSANATDPSFAPPATGQLASSPTFATFSHSPTIGSTGSQAKFARSTVSSNHSYDALMSNPQDQAAANDVCAQRRRPGRSQSVNDSQKLGGLAVRPRRQQLCTSTGRFASEDCEATSYIGCPPDKPA